MLAAFAPKLSQKAAKALESLGVTPMVDHTVTDIDADGVVIGDERIRAGTIIWAAGVLASGARRASWPRRQAPTSTSVGRHDRRARPLAPRPPRGARDRRHGAGARAGPAPGRRAGGDADGALRGASSSATGCARARTRSRSSTRTRATWPRSGARGRSPNCRRGIRASGFFAWALWLGIHLFYLIGFQNRLLVLLRWSFSFLTHGRGTRLITGEKNMP